MDETVSGYSTPREKVEHLKELLKNARAEVRTERINIVKSKINTGKAKVGHFFKKQAANLRDTIGLIPLNIAKGYNNVARNLAEKRKTILTKRIERRTIILSKVNTAKAKVGNFNKRIVNGFKNAANKVKEVFTPNPEKRAELLADLKKQREELEALREENKRLREAGTYENLSGRSRGSINYNAIFALTLVVFAMFATIIVWLIMK